MAVVAMLLVVVAGCGKKEVPPELVSDMMTKETNLESALANARKAHEEWKCPEYSRAMQLANTWVAGDYQRMLAEQAATVVGSAVELQAAIDSVVQAGGRDLESTRTAGKTLADVTGAIENDFACADWRSCPTNTTTSFANSGSGGSDLERAGAALNTVFTSGQRESVRKTTLREYALSRGGCPCCMHLSLQAADPRRCGRTNGVLQDASGEFFECDGDAPSCGEMWNRVLPGGAEAGIAVIRSGSPCSKILRWIQTGSLRF